MILKDEIDYDKLRERAEKCVTSNILDSIYTRVVNRTIRKLRKLDYALLSSEDSGLKNFWDEYCVQVQGELFINFEVYRQTLENYLLDELNKEPKEIRDFYYVHSEFEESDYASFISYEKDNQIKKFSYSCPTNVSVFPLLNHIDEIAGSYTNKQIQNYHDM